MLIKILYMALKVDVGLKVSNPSPRTLRQKLIAQKRELNDPALECLEIVISPDKPTDELWIYKGGKKDA